MSVSASESNSDHESDWEDVTSDEDAEHDVSNESSSTADAIPITTYAYNIQRVFFGDGYPTPFVRPSRDDWEGSKYDWGDAPRTVAELTMCMLSATLRDKPDWQVKMTDPVIRAKWREEALATPVGRAEWALTEKMVDYVLDELQGYANLIDEKTGIQVGCFERVWQSDSLVPDSLRQELLASVATLENVPEEEKDWHPNSNGQVLDLVHPSLYPIVYGRTLHRDEKTGALKTIRAPMKKKNPYISEHFAWLPSDFVVSADGETATLSSPYINNLRRKELHPIIDKLVSLAVPMWERVLSDLKRPMTPLRTFTESITNRTFSGNVIGVPCIWENESPYPPSDLEEELQDDEEALDAWYDAQPKRIPDAQVYLGAVDSMKKTVSLAGQSIQVIVKLANIQLTPEKPRYPGGTWHVEGMENEGIVSTFIYYYDQENITDSRLDFQTAIHSPLYHEQNDDRCMRILYDMDRESAQVQSLGGVLTKHNRCIAFPNIYQHQVQPFELQDKTKSGHRKIVALFLINPLRKIPSATTVPPQQREWLGPDLWKALHPKLPVELVELVVQMCDFMDLEEAHEVRKKLMKERSKMVKKNSDNAFGVEFDMCEH